MRPVLVVFVDQHRDPLVLLDVPQPLQRGGRLRLLIDPDEHLIPMHHISHRYDVRPPISPHGRQPPHPRSSNPSPTSPLIQSHTPSLTTNFRAAASTAIPPTVSERNP